MLKITVPIATLAEQQPIVAKADKLMALRERQEACLVTDDDARRRLLETQALYVDLAPVEPHQVAAHG